MSENTRTSPIPPTLAPSIVDGRGIPCTPPPEATMPELRDVAPAKLKPAPLDWQGNPKEAA